MMEIIKELNMKQIWEIRQFKRFLKEEFCLEVDDNIAGRLWIHFYAEDYRKGNYRGFGSNKTYKELTD